MRPEDLSLVAPDPPLNEEIRGTFFDRNEADAEISKIRKKINSIISEEKFSPFYTSLYITGRSENSPMELICGASGEFMTLLRVVFCFDNDISNREYQKDGRMRKVEISWNSDGFVKSIGKLLADDYLGFRNRVLDMLRNHFNNDDRYYSIDDIIKMHAEAGYKLKPEHPDFLPDCLVTEKYWKYMAERRNKSYIGKD